jgi:antitoxin (DNA-binding transcriptional repressor) of toxin-antitoxin stability system
LAIDERPVFAKRSAGRINILQLFDVQGRPAFTVPLAAITSVDYDVTISGIRIAELKSRLSEHPRKVRAGGSLTILDRDSPIARIVSWKAGGGSLKIVEVTHTVLARAAQPLPTALGALDAMHLATALLWKEQAGKELSMATHDVALAVAAKASGLRVHGA